MLCRILFPFYCSGNLYKLFVGQIGPFQSTKSERAKVKVKVRLNMHGIVSIESATVSLWKLL